MAAVLVRIAVTRSLTASRVRSRTRHELAPYWHRTFHGICPISPLRVRLLSVRTTRRSPSPGRVVVLTGCASDFESRKGRRMTTIGLRRANKFILGAPIVGSCCLPSSAGAHPSVPCGRAFAGPDERGSPSGHTACRASPPGATRAPTSGSVGSRASPVVGDPWSTCSTGSPASGALSGSRSAEEVEPCLGRSGAAPSRKFLLARGSRSRPGYWAGDVRENVEALRRLSTTPSLKPKAEDSVRT
jgi:hypothetical protein